jgi:hypothetical protein
VLSVHSKNGDDLGSIALRKQSFQVDHLDILRQNEQEPMVVFRRFAFSQRLMMEADAVTPDCYGDRNPLIWLAGTVMNKILCEHEATVVPIIALPWDPGLVDAILLSTLVVDLGLKTARLRSTLHEREVVHFILLKSLFSCDLFTDRVI